VLRRGVVANCQISYARGFGLRVVKDLGRSSVQSITSRSAVDAAAAVVCDPIVARESIGIGVPNTTSRPR
jgi:hypothetical protein